jgi:ribosomal protein S18 acetylase RimI-like enzyme
MAELTIRDATPADIPALHRLIESAYRGDSARRGWSSEADLLAGQRTDHEDLADILAGPRQAILMAHDQGDLRGCVMIEGRDQGVGYFGMLSVVPELQSGGVGRALVRAAEAALIARYGVRRVEISVFPQRETLIAWYERLAYELTGATLPFDYDNPRLGIPLRDDLHFVVMAKSLA